MKGLVSRCIGRPLLFYIRIAILNKNGNESQGNSSKTIVEILRSASGLGVQSDAGTIAAGKQAQLYVVFSIAQTY
jgi:hypothetical protein